MAAIIVPYAAFLEIRTRRQRVIAELVQPQVNGAGQPGPPAGVPLTIEGAAITVIQQPTDTVACRVLPVEM